MSGTDKLDGIAKRHEAVDVSKAMAEAAPPAPERITKPTNPAAVERIAKRRSVPASED